MEFKQILSLLGDITFNQIEEIDKEKLVFSNEVRQICAGNGCGRYGKTWTCPPGVGPVSEWKERMLGYDHAVMFNYVGEIEDSFDFETMTEIGAEFDQKVRAVKKILEDNQVDFLIFGAGSCSLCKPCSYPDAPCKRPKDAIPSVEACGLFIARIAEPCGFKYINGTNTVTYFGLIMYND
ncbi:MAG: DUF2284 domain-containing protein [Clostridia bacterium]|nr:DUF2284 domain-containing protein [Clostridia bacterium]